jgi:hypothetical protein
MILLEHRLREPQPNVQAGQLSPFFEKIKLSSKVLKTHIDGTPAKILKQS